MPPRKRRTAEVLTENAHGPDGQVRFRGEAPADEWYAPEHAWFLEDLRGMDRLVPGEPDETLARTTAGTSWELELRARGARGRAGKAGS